MSRLAVDRPTVWPIVAVHSANMSDRGAAIRKARRKRRWSTKDLAEATGVSDRTIGRIERGEVKDSPNIETLEAELRPELEQLARDAAQAAAGDIGAASFLQALAHLGSLHADVTGENEELRRENAELRRELADLGGVDPDDDVEVFHTKDAPSAQRTNGNPSRARDGNGQRA